MQVRTLSKHCRRYGVLERWPCKSSTPRPLPAAPSSRSRVTCRGNRGHPCREATRADQQVQTVHWSRDQVESAKLVQGDDVRLLLEHLSALYYQQHGKQPTVDEIKVWDVCLRSMRVDCTERKMLGDGQYHQVVKLSGLLLTRDRNARGMRVARGRQTQGTGSGGRSANWGGKSSALAGGGARHKNSKCAAGDCPVTPSYADAQELLIRGRHASWVCKQHTGSLHVNVRACARCEHHGCIKLAVFGSPGDRVKLRCAAHQLATDVRLQQRRTCAAGDEAGQACQRRPIFGERGRRARHCRLHKLAGEEDVVHKHCESAACGKQASFGDASEGSPRFCIEHKLAWHTRARGNGYTRLGSRKARLGAARTKTGAVVLAAGVGAAVQPAGARRHSLNDALVLRIYEGRPLGSGGRYGRMSALSARYGVSRKTIWDIWNRRSWVKTTRAYWTAAEAAAYLSARRPPSHQRRDGSRPFPRNAGAGADASAWAQGATLDEVRGFGSEECDQATGELGSGSERMLQDARAADLGGWLCAQRSSAICPLLSPAAPLWLSPRPMWFEHLDVGGQGCGVAKAVWRADQGPPPGPGSPGDLQGSPGSQGGGGDESGPGPPPLF